MIKAFNKKIIVSGNVVEIYDYEKPIIKGVSHKPHGRANAPFTDEIIKANNRKKIAQRARQTVRRTANANPQLKKFLTLTYAENITDLQTARKDFDIFIKRIKRNYKYFQFVVVIEFQKRGAIHFHMLCNLPYVNVNKLSEIWKHGFIKINKIDNVDNVGAYITKYMTKDNIDERLIGKKCYSMSYNLRKPQEITDEQTIEDFIQNLESVKRIYTSEFETEYYGKVSYTQIICEKIQRVHKKSLIQHIRPFLIPLPPDLPTPFD